MAGANPFRTFKRNVPEDPTPNVLTEEERAYILERLEAGAAPRAGLIKKIIRLADDRQRKLDRVLGVCELVKDRFSKEDVSHIENIIQGSHGP